MYDVQISALISSNLSQTCKLLLDFITHFEKYCFISEGANFEKSCVFVVSIVSCDGLA